ncbi:putative phiE125 gp8 family phage protein [Pseudoduganella lurida]|uniref:Putative phiE125 gp8 family phage protein n=1 Tax=Pseudoduganella lurida TaxID=1036180 RepID=A0A562R9B9_9BURK|nr:hypothetical protein [Pseudoduganella lurida]TWI65174.1 putative phiE125 gp8 family phage protein [Pseudoduganella lurida]
MKFIRTAAPAAMPVHLRQAAANLGIDGPDSDEAITGWLKGIVAHLEKQIGQSLMRQTWVGTLPGFPAVIALPHPVLRVVSIDYVDEAGDEQALSLSTVRLTVPDEYTTLLKPARGRAWPATFSDEEAVRITVECGYGDSPDATPDDLRLYILAKLVEQYDPAAGGEKVTVQTSYLDSLLDPYRSFA